MKRLALLVLCSTALLAIGCSKTENTAGTSNTNATTGSNATAGPATTERTRATTRTTARTTGTTAPGGGSLASQLKEFQSAMQAEGLPVTDDQVTCVIGKVDADTALKSSLESGFDSAPASDKVQVFTILMACGVSFDDFVALSVKQMNAEGKYTAEQVDCAKKALQSLGPDGLTKLMASPTSEESQKFGVQVAVDCKLADSSGGNRVDESTSTSGT